MSPTNLSLEIRQKAELLHAEIVGRIHACEHLESEMENISDPRILYGWNLLTQEVLIRLAEASLKLLHMIYLGVEAGNIHSLADLWAKLPEDAQEEVLAKRLAYPNGETGVSFSQYDGDDFQDVRYSYQRRAGGQTMRFEPRRLFLDSFAVRDVAEDCLGEIEAWPWAGFLDLALAGYEIIPTAEGKFDVWVKNPIRPMDWAGAIIEPRDGQYSWTLYCGFTDRKGEKKSYRIESMHYSWPIDYLLSNTVEECVERIHRAYKEPSISLQMAIEEAIGMKENG